jgi:hypothetical protein
MRRPVLGSIDIRKEKESLLEKASPKSSGQ